MTDRRLSVATLFPPDETGTRNQRSWKLVVLNGCIVKVHPFVGASTEAEAKARAVEVIGHRVRWQPFGTHAFQTHV